jgi:hypothetical protein
MAALPEGVPPGTVPTGLRVEQWGLLQWKSRWLTHDTQQRVKVYESNAEWDGTARPFFEADLSAPGACAIQDATRPARARLDAGGKLLHLRFESEEHCTRFVHVLCSTLRSTPSRSVSTEWRRTGWGMVGSVWPRRRSTRRLESGSAARWPDPQKSSAQHRCVARPPALPCEVCGGCDVTPVPPRSYARSRSRPPCATPTSSSCVIWSCTVMSMGARSSA